MASAYLTASHAVLSLLLLLVIIIQVLLCPSYGEEQKLKGEVKRLLDPLYRLTLVELRCVVDERESQPTYLFSPGVAWLPMVMGNEIRHFERHPESRETKTKIEPKTN